jgi:hypothetical protein
MLGFYGCHNAPGFNIKSSDTGTQEVNIRISVNWFMPSHLKPSGSREY